MKKSNVKNLVISFTALVLFVVWTVLVRVIDVQKIGPLESEVGFASMNSLARTLFGVNLSLYVITDWLSILPLAIVFAFAVLGLCQLIRRKSLVKVDYDILALGCFYIVVFSGKLFAAGSPKNRLPAAENVANGFPLTS